MWGRSVCDWHTRTVHGLEHRMCSVNITCSGDLLICVCVPGGTCAYVCKCVEVKGQSQLPYAPQELSRLLETGPLIFTWNSQGSSCPQFSIAGYKCKPPLYTPAQATCMYAHIQMRWGSHQMAGFVHHSSCESTGNVAAYFPLIDSR